MIFCRSAVLCCLLAFSNLVMAAAPVTKPYKIMMMLYRGTTDAERGFMEYFKRRNIPVEFIVRDAQADNSLIPEFVREAKSIRPDLIYTFGTTVTAGVVGLAGEVDPARNITDIPVVFNIVADPVGAKLVTSLDSSGRNLTGASHLVPLEAQMKALQAMRRTQTLGVIYNPQEKNSALAVQQLEEIARKLRLTLHLAPVMLDEKSRPTPEGLQRSMQELLAKKPEFVYIPSDSFLIKNASIVVRASRAAGIPVFAATEAPIRSDGALLGLVSTYSSVGEFAAYKAEQILVKKTSPGKIPIQVLQRFTYLVNMNAAKKLGIFPPVSVIKFAEIVTPPDNFDARE